MTMMEECDFYICAICFSVGEYPGTHNNREMAYCEQLRVGYECLKPVIDLEGDLKIRAPRRFLEAVWDAAGMEYPADLQS